MSAPAWAQSEADCAPAAAIASQAKALAANASTFTVVRMEDILDPQGVIATLQARGYTVEPPK